MEFLSEDPTYLAGGLGLLALAFLIALKLTQQGKYLIWAGASLALALLVIGVERVWVTDNERIEAAVYDLGKAVEASDAAGALERMTPDVQYVAAGSAMPSEATRAMIKTTVSNVTFDFLRITHLRANAGGQSRRGTAEFQVIAGGSYPMPSAVHNFATHNSVWSLGFRETSRGVRKVNRITPVHVPGGQAVLPSTSGPRVDEPSPRDFVPGTDPAASLGGGGGGGGSGRGRRGMPRPPGRPSFPLPGLPPPPAPAP
jgi:hypothetical protein